MRNRIAAILAALISFIGLAAVAAPAPASAASCVFETHRAQYWDTTYKTKQNGMKVTCPTTYGRNYQIVITCSDGITTYGNIVTPGNTSKGLCTSYYEWGDMFPVYKVTSYYIKVR